MTPQPRTSLGQWLGSLPRLTRLTAQRELAATIPLGIASAVLHSGFFGLVGVKGLHISGVMFSVLMALPAVGFLLAGSLVGFLHDSRKVTVITWILVALSAVLFAIVLVPDEQPGEPGIRAAAASSSRLAVEQDTEQSGSPTPNDHVEQSPAVSRGASVFIVLILFAHVGVALMITLRTAVWRANYPAGSRGKLVVMINLAAALVSSGGVFVFSQLMDCGLSFKVVYAVAAAGAATAALLFSRIRVRREKTTLRNLSQTPGRSARLVSGLVVLKRDRRFRQYMSWQMFNGFSTMIVEVILVMIIADVFEVGWFVGGSVLAAVPLLVAAPAGLLWARVFDRTDIFTARFYGAMTWALSRVILAVGVAYGSISLVIVSRAVSGAGMGCGQICWRLGHMAFAPPEQDSLYMGAHISLTGLRGIIAPFLGMFLYHLSMPGPQGVWLIVVTMACQALSAFAFLAMRKNQ